MVLLVVDCVGEMVLLVLGRVLAVLVLLVVLLPAWWLELGGTVVLVDCRSRWNARVS